MNLRKDVRDLISVNEKIQSAIMQGDLITDDEASVIRLCASELLEKVPPPQMRARHAEVSRKDNTVA
jgi:hypothetical protein